MTLQGRDPATHNPKGKTMGMQNFSSPAGRNPIKAGEIKIGNPQSPAGAPRTAPTADGPSVRGFGSSGKSIASSGSEGKAGVSSGPSVQGFTGTGLKPGKI